MTTLKMILPAICNQYKKLHNAEIAATAIIEALERSKRFPIHHGELSIVFVDDPTIAEIHERFMSDPSATDVITFPADPEMDSAGEIILSVDHAQTRAIEINVPFHRELSLYLAHGWLHLAGYNDQTPEDRKKMRQVEDEAMKIIESEATDIRFSLSNP